MPSVVIALTTSWVAVATAVTGARIFADLDPNNVLLAVGTTLPTNDTTAFSMEDDEDGMTLEDLALQNVYARAVSGTDRLRVIPLSDNFSSAQPTSSATGAIVPVKTAAAAASLVGKASAGNLYGFNVKAIDAGTAQKLLVFDSATVPADGAVAPILAYDVPAAGTLSQSFNPPIRCSAGISFALSSAVTPFTKTLSAAANFALISALVQ